MARTPASPRLPLKDRIAPNSNKTNNDHRKANKRQNRRKARAAKTKGSGVIDMTEETDDELDTGTDSPKFFSGLEDGPSISKSASHRRAQPGPSKASPSIKGKERASPEPTKPVFETVAEIEKSSFKPMNRSIMSGWKLSMSRSPSPPHKRARTDSPQVEIFIDEQPAAGPSSPRLDTAADQGDNSHFEPPGLFSTSLVPSKKTKRTLRREEQRQQGGDREIAGDDGEEVKEQEVASGQETLLLPSHVMLASVSGDAGSTDTGDQPMNDSDGVHILDDSKAKGVQRYFDPEAGTDDVSTFLASADQSKMCMNCKRPGHNQRDCPHVICPTCGKEDEHERRDCPYNLICFRCGVAGHKIQDCTKPRTKGGACDRCGANDHTAIVCPMIWRLYSYYSVEERTAVLEDHSAAKGWAKEAIGGREHERWCYNCAQEGHFGDDCPRSRGSLARFAPSAFSKLSQSRGPFASSLSSLSGGGPFARPTHQRFDSSDEDEDENHRLPGQSAPFAGLGAGKKTIEKRKRIAMDQERQFGGSEPRRPVRGGAGSRGQAQGGDSLPFGHRHFMTPTGPGRNGKGSSNGNGNGSPFVRNGSRKGQATDSPDSNSNSPQIQFGKLSMPGDTPQRPPPPRGSASTTLVNRALRQSNNVSNSPKTPTVNLNSQASGNINGSGNTSSPLASSAKRRKKKSKTDVGAGAGLEEGEIEEVAFRKSGAGGGKVEGWGRELDEEERKAKKVNKAAKKREKEEKQVPTPASGGGGGGLSIKGRSQVSSTPGQKYHGGY